ncbi:MAG: hypothetical protein ACFCU5_18525 [Pleurocapsa sp.]
MNKKVILLSKLSIAITFIYGIYLIKTAAGINLSSRYSAPQIFKLPLVVVEPFVDSHKANLKGKIKRVKFIYNVVSSELIERLAQEQEDIEEVRRPKTYT